jgi:hypothetical protein
MDSPRELSTVGSARIGDAGGATAFLVPEVEPGLTVGGKPYEVDSIDDTVFGARARGWDLLRMFTSLMVTMP